MLRKLILPLLTSVVLSFLYHIYSPIDLTNTILIGVILFIPLAYSMKKGDWNGLYLNLATGLGLFITIESLIPSKDFAILSLAVSLLASFLITYFRNRAEPLSKNNYTKITLSVLFFVLWIILAFNVGDKQDWIMENSVMIVSGIILFSLNWKNRVFSETSALSIFFFSLIHIVGAHYTYMSVPFGYTFTDYFLLSRNYYDTFVHFMFGALLFLPFREIYISQVKDRGVVSYIFPISIICSFALCYEVIEWLTTFFLSQDTIPMFLATQGDMFDTQKDMLASLVSSVLVAILLKIMSVFPTKK